MSEQFEKIVRIREELSAKLIFGFKARIPIAIILGYTGYRHEVMPLMQILSHTTRAFTCNADGLPNFVIKREFIHILKDADEKK